MSFDPFGFGDDPKKKEREARANMDEQARWYWDRTAGLYSPDYQNDFDLYAPGMQHYQLETPVNQQDSQFRTARADPEAEFAQRKQLNELERVYQMGGLSEIDLARQEESRRRAAIQAKGQREADVAEMEARGFGGSGREVLARETAASNAANQQSMENLQTEALALQRRDQLLKAYGDTAGNIRVQSWGENADRAAAQDEINRFNAQGDRDRGMRNAQALRDREQQAWDRYGQDRTRHDNRASNYTNIQLGKSASLMNQAQRQAADESERDTEARKGIYTAASSAFGGGF